jgi:hypothetical protein
VTRGDLTPPTHDERRALADVAGMPAWKWVTQVYKNSGLSVDLLDEHLTLLTVPARGGSARAADQPLADAVRALASSLAEGERKSAVVAGRRFYGVPITPSGVFAGAMLVGADHERARDVDVQSAVTLLTRALEDFLSPDDDRRTTAGRLHALHDLLDEASSTASEQHVFQAFAEIVNVWHDVEVLGYRGDLAGRFALTGSLPGSDRSAIPDAIAAEVLPADGVVTLSTALQKQLGFTSPRYPSLVRLSTAGGPWLIALTQRQGNQPFGEWFDFYFAALTTSLNASLEVEVARTTWAIMQHLAENESPREAVTQAILGVAQSLPAETGFAMWEPDGVLALSIGEPPSAALGDSGRAPNVLRTRIDAPAGRHALLEMRAALGHQFTRRDVKVFEAAVWTLSRWFSTAGGQLAAAPENAAAAQSFDEVVERYLRARERSWSPALILIMPSSADAPTDLAYEWIRRLRSELRPTDLAGRLTTGEVAVVAVETTPPGALAVAQRISRVLNESIDVVQKRVRVGLAAGDRVSTSAHGLIAEARQHLVDA